MLLRSLEHSLKEMREQQDETMAGQRGSRIAKWTQSSAELRQKAGLSSPEKLKNFGIVWECLGRVEYVGMFWNVLDAF